MAVDLCDVVNFEMGGYGSTATYLFPDAVDIVNGTNVATSITLNIRINTKAHAKFKPIISTNSTGTGPRLWEGYWYDVNHNVNGVYQVGPSVHLGPTGIYTFPATITIPASTTLTVYIGTDNQDNGDHNYSGTNKHTLVDISNCTAVIESIANDPPISLFFCNTAEGLQVDITDLSSDPDGQDDIRKWEFSFNATGEYHGAGSSSITSVSDVLTFDRDITANNLSTSTFAGIPPATFRYRYNTEGTRDIELTVTDAAGAETTSQLPEPYVAVTLDPSAGFAVKTYRDNRNADFTDNSTDIDGAIIKWEWNFGDGNTQTDNGTTTPFTYTYAANGAYTVTLTVTDNIGKTGTISNTIDVPRVNANVVFVNSGPISPGFTSSALSATSAINTATDNYEGPCFSPWYRTVDVIGVDPTATAAAFNNPVKPLSIKTLTEDAEANYKVDFMSPNNGTAPYGMGEWYNAEIPPPAIETPNPPDVAIGGGLYSVTFDSQTYFQTFIDVSGSMNAYAHSYQTASNGVSQEMAAVFFNNDAALARKYIRPYVNIGNERWGDWAMTTLYPASEPPKQVIISAINEDSSGGPGTGNAAILAKAQAIFDAGGHYYYILIAPPGSSAGSLYSSGPALANTRVNVNGQQIRWCQWSRESSSGGALTNVIKQILGFNAI